MVTPKQVQSYIEKGLRCSEVRVVGDGEHFEALIVSEAFRGKSRVQRHQLVYAALCERMREAIHEQSMRTLTPEEAADGEALNPGGHSALDRDPRFGRDEIGARPHVSGVLHDRVAL